MMKLTYRGQSYTFTQPAATATTTVATKESSYVLRYRGIIYLH